MKNLYMLIGLPRSGKTTWAKQKQELSGGVIVSADAIRWSVYGQRFWELGEPLVWGLRDVLLRTLLEQGVDIIIDETNTKEARRTPTIKIAKNYGYEVYGVIVSTTAEECIRRAEDEEDDKIIPVIQRMAEQYEQPSPLEGFHKIRLWEFLEEGME